MAEEIIPFIVVGFLAQLIDGALGMAYGVSSTSFLLSLGVPPAVASASVHTAEVFTTAVSGFSHWRMGNIDRQLFKRLVIPGAIGGFVGAYVLTSVPGDTIKPFITAYLLVMGAMILWKALRRNESKPWGRMTPLGLAGGFCDAVGGGGWGPIVSSTLVATGHCPRRSIGSVNAAEFLVTFVQAVTFVTILGFAQNWKPIIGLIVGGVAAAPLAAHMCRILPRRGLMGLVGVLIVLVGVRTTLGMAGYSINWVYFAVPMVGSLLLLSVLMAIRKTRVEPVPQGQGAD